MSSAERFGPGKLWSLWDMLDLLFGSLHYMLQILESRAKTWASIAKIPSDQFDQAEQKTEVDDLKKFLAELKAKCLEHHFEQSCNSIDRILKRLERKIDYAHIAVSLEDLSGAIHDEGKHDSIYLVPRDRSKLLYDEPHPWKPVSAAFPSATNDSVSAILCYMYDENTASVFHSMRVLEAGLAALSEALGLTFEAEVWAVIIDRIESEIRELERTWPKGHTKSAFLQFYSSAAKEFRYFKDGWRNFVTHRRAEYDAPQALSTLNHVRDFMIQISTRLSEIA